MCVMICWSFLRAGGSDCDIGAGAVVFFSAFSLCRLVRWCSAVRRREYCDVPVPFDGPVAYVFSFFFDAP